MIARYTPTLIEMSNNPYDNELQHNIIINGKHKTLGLIIKMCPIRQLPKLTRCLPGTPSARIPKWRSTLCNSYILTMNGKPVQTTDDIT